MNIRYSRRALSQLASVSKYLHERDRSAADNVIRDNGIALSAHLKTDREIDDDIDAKIASLEALRPRMKDALRAHK